MGAETGKVIIVKTCRQCKKEYDIDTAKIQEGTEVTEAGYCSVECCRKSYNKNPVSLERKNLDDALNIDEPKIRKCEHGIETLLECDRCHEEGLETRMSDFQEGGRLYQKPTLNRLEEASKGLNILSKKIDKQKSDTYWHRRWAGDALKGFCANNEFLKDAGSEDDSLAECAFMVADAMLKVYKEKEENGKDS